MFLCFVLLHMALFYVLAYGQPNAATDWAAPCMLAPAKQAAPIA